MVKARTIKVRARSSCDKHWSTWIKSELPRDYVWSWARLQWKPEYPRFEGVSHVSSCQAAGCSWVDAGGELAVQVPSVVIPEEFNGLLNSMHPEHAVSWRGPRPFRFDPYFRIRATDFVDRNRKQGSGRFWVAVASLFAGLRMVTVSPGTGRHINRTSG
jgi:hypothetical protein